MSFQLVFIYLSIYLFILFLFFIINQLLCSSFSANLPSIFKHLVLLSSISFLVILSKYYLFLY